MQTTHASASWNVPGPEILVLPIRFDDASAPRVEEDAMLCIKSGAQQLILDAEDVTYMTAAGLRTLLVLAQTMKQAGGTLSICGLDDQAKEIFEACGFDALIPAYSQTKEAMARMAA